MGIDKLSQADDILIDQDIDPADLANPAQQKAELAQDIEGK